MSADKQDMLEMPVLLMRCHQSRDVLVHVGLGKKLQGGSGYQSSALH